MVHEDHNRVPNDTEDQTEYTKHDVPPEILDQAVVKVTEGQGLTEG